MDFEAAFKECLYYTTHSLHREIAVLAEESFASLGLTPSYAYLLMVIYQFKEISTTDAAKKIGLQPSTVTRLADKMVLRGYITRKHEGRNSLLIKAEKLDDEMGKIFACWRKLNVQYKELLGEKQVDRLIKIMNTSKNKL
ncbi:MarR family winged helix-turn-helix transcriptional regulator [Aquimarina rhabdastrellae]